MSFGFENGFFYFAPALVMLLIFCVNLVISHQRAEKRSSAEAARFQVAMLTELECLAELYRKNLNLLRRGSDYLLSTRSAIVVYRGNVGRLTLLDEAAIKCLVVTHAENERIEILLTARAKTVQSGPALIYRFESNGEIGEFKRMYVKALGNVSQACEILRGEKIPDEAKLPLNTPSSDLPVENIGSRRRSNAASAPKTRLPSAAE